MFPEDLHVSVHDLCQLDPAQPVIVAVSGGADSLCLMTLLHEMGLKIIVAHFDHQIRTGSEQDAALVKQIAEQSGVPFILGTGDVRAYSNEHNLSIEEAARILRYQFLLSIARDQDAQAVAVGHTADDQVETVLMHLLRGAGLAGLKGMEYRSIVLEWDDQIPIVRPLLSVWRSQTEACCQQRGLTPVHDKTNQDKTFFRNRLRLELIPLLEQYIPGVKDRIWQTADLLSGDDELLEQITGDIWDRVCQTQDENRVVLDRDLLTVQKRAMQRRLIRRAALVLLPGLRNLDYKDVERALAFVHHPPMSRQIDWTAHLSWRAEQNQLILFRSAIDPFLGEAPAVPAGTILQLQVPGEVQLGGGWLISAEWGDRVGDRNNPMHAWLDGDRNNLQALSIRARKPGDRFQPYGMNQGTMKISDFFINEKLPRELRRSWPLVLVGDEIAWVPGYRLSHRFRICEITQKILHLELTRFENQ